MPYIPVRVGEKLRILKATVTSPNQEAIDQRLLEEMRVEGIIRRRQYVDGEQYDDLNDERTLEVCGDPAGRLPEHERKHAYSTHIGESIRFIADQLAEQFDVECQSPLAQDIIDSALQLSGQLSGTDAADDVSIEDLLEDVLTAGDVPVELRWDDAAGAVFFDLWESELIEIEWADRDNFEKVTRRELIWVEDPDVLGEDGEPGRKQIEERTEWFLDENRVDDTVWLECRKLVWHDDDNDPVLDEWTGMPMIPWGLLRCQKKGLRGQRGESLVSRQAMEAADRFNAAGNVGYVIARRNSHSNLAVAGDAALLKLDNMKVLDKDVDDVLTFPGGTSVTSVTLPTSPEMLEHQQRVLAESIYNRFGLTRVEPDTLQGLGDVSGYALEIMNRKTEGTFRKVRRHFKRDLRTLFTRTIELWEALSLGGVIDPDIEAIEPQPEGVPAWVGIEYTVDTDIEIRLGTGYVVDEVLQREDYTAKLVSRRHVLRTRGMSNKEITQIEEELTLEAEMATAAFSSGLGEQSRFAPQAGNTRGADERDTDPEAE